MKVTVTGASGFIGRRLVRRLLEANHSVHLLVRSPRAGLGAIPWSLWDALAGDPPAASLEGAEAVIHLAGEPIAQRWTPVVKDRILRSRVEGTRRLIQALAGLEQRPHVLVCASAVGFYGSRGDEVLTEESPPGSGFLSQVCMGWEKAANAAAELGIRVVSLRFGVVLGTEGGALARMLPPFRWGLGGRVGSGAQWMSWIHVDDLVELVCFLLEQPQFSGVANATAPNPVRNAEFTATLAGVLRRPALVPVPALALKALFGEMAEILLGSQRVLPRAAESAGFRFRYAHLEAALRQLLG